MVSMPLVKGLTVLILLVVAIASPHHRGRKLLAPAKERYERSSSVSISTAWSIPQRRRGRRAGHRKDAQVHGGLGCRLAHQ